MLARMISPNRARIPIAHTSFCYAALFPGRPGKSLFRDVSDLVPIVKGVAAFRAELGRMRGVRRLPAAFVALVLGHAGGLFRPALGAEFTLVHRSAGTGPAVRGRLGLAALRAELSSSRRTAGALPALC